ncbi:MAG: hypothetical protein HC902_11850 [Calothrix sp. SM1_5_4]|nr:hypothetical protein [Calothrix sp. SM1_5_4]
MRLSVKPLAVTVHGIDSQCPNRYWGCAQANRRWSELLLYRFDGKPAAEYSGGKINDNIAAILFLNPAFCSLTDSPQPSDIGLEEDMGILSHAFTYLGPNRRFEKAGPLANQPYQFVDVSSASAKYFVHCSPMQGWISYAMSTATPDQIALDSDLARIEKLMDLRFGGKGDNKYTELKTILTRVEGETHRTSNALYAQIKNLLHARGVNEIPFPGMLNGDYYRFAQRYPDLLQDSEIFRLLWLSSRLAAANEYFIYYHFH